MPNKTDQGGGIIRVAHDARNPYTVINRTFTEDPALSWEARGLLAYLLCKPDNWTVMFNNLVHQGNAGRVMMRRMLKELEAAGYLRRTKSRNPVNGYWQWTSTIYESPGVGDRPMDDRPADDPPPANLPINKVVTAPSSNGNDYREEGAPPMTEVDDIPAAVRAHRARLQAAGVPTLADVDAGRVPRRGVLPDERR